MKMRFGEIIIICIIILVNSNTSLNEISEEEEESLNLCLKLKKDAPYLNLNCDKILEKEEKKNIKVKNLKDNENFIKYYRTISFDFIQENTKKINLTDEKKLRNLIRQLRN